MFQGNPKMFLLKEDEIDTNPLWLIYHDYYKEYQILGSGLYVYATIAITPNFNAREVALKLFDSIKNEMMELPANHGCWDCYYAIDGGGCVFHRGEEECCADDCSDYQNVYA